MQTGFLQNDKAGITETAGRVEDDTPIAERTLEAEDSTTLAPEAAAGEAGRCMNCGCYSVNASDITPVLIALDATVVTNRKRISAEKLFTSALRVEDMLEPGEIITEFDIPVPEGQSHYSKFRLRDSVDFAMVSAASECHVEEGVVKSASIVLGGVAPVPVRRKKAENYLIGKELNRETAEQAAEIALEDVVPFEKNEYKVDVAKSLIRESLIG